MSIESSGNAKDIFLAAIEIDSPNDRAAFINNNCGDDDDLRQRVDALILAHEAPGSLLNNVAPGLNEVASLNRTVEFEGGERAGMQIGPYKLRERLGAGGMGVVWAADQKEPLRRRVALKVVKAGMDSEQVLARFDAEREALSLMDHPNIARVLDAGVTQRGRSYFVMELIRGTPITEYCDNQKLSVQDRLVVFTKVCHAIQHAHQKGIIHRDIKPSNVLVTEQDGESIPKVIDFGVAKALNQRLTDHSIYTSVQSVIGTPLYMSPEQATTSNVDVDTRSDVYSLGVLLYELLSGTTPIDKESLRNAAQDEVLRIIREQDPEKPSTKVNSLGSTAETISRCRRTDVASLGRLVRGDLDWIVLKAMAKERGRRYKTADAFALDISRHLKDVPVEARSPSWGYRATKFARRNLKPLAFGSFIFALVAAVGVMWLANNASARHQRLRSLVNSSMTASPDALPALIGEMQPHRSRTIRLIRQRMRGNTMSPEEQLNATCILSILGEPDTKSLLDSVRDAPASTCRILVNALAEDPQEALAGIQSRTVDADVQGDFSLKARFAILSLHLGRPALAKEMCAPQSDSTQRRWFIEESSSWHGDLIELAQIMVDLDDPDCRSALILAVGSARYVTVSEKEAWKPLLQRWYTDAPDRITHSAVFRAIRRWNLPIPSISPTNGPVENRHWYVNQAGITMIKVNLEEVPEPVDDDPLRDLASGWPPTTAFYMSDCEITRRQFDDFVNDATYPAPEKATNWADAGPWTGANLRCSPSLEHPVQEVSWYDAIKFCNWLSRTEGLTCCYERTGELEQIGHREDELAVPRQVWRFIADANGYRLPTSSEWYYAARAGNPYPVEGEFWERYVHMLSSRTVIAAEKLPNSWGLFHTYGNVFEWTRMGSVCGGSFLFQAKFSRTAKHPWPCFKFHQLNNIGFRVIRPATSE